jgi:hypothetical protein
MPIVALSAVLVASASHRAQAQSLCRPMESVSHQMKDFVAKLIVSTDPSVVAMRDSVSLPKGVASDVVVVSDTTVCSAAAGAYARTGPATRFRVVYPVWVMKVGPKRYVVFNPDKAPGNLLDLVVFDDKFRYKATIAIM